MIDLLPEGFCDPHELCALPPDAPVLVGFSGGVDSTSLLHMLTVLRRRTPFPLYALHVHHGLRGKEADRDEEFCRQTAEALGVIFFSAHIDVPTLARDAHMGVEEAARHGRYDAFLSCMRQHNIPLLVTAHHADDNLETMLFHMVRGTSLHGLCGIPLCRRLGEGQVCRPLLGVSHAAILAYCEAHGLSYVCDSTNGCEDYTRNRIRDQVLPVLREIHPGAVENVARLSASLREDALCLQSMADWFLEELEEDASLSVEKLLGTPVAVGNCALCTLFAHSSNGFHLEQVHLSALRTLCVKAVPHSSLSLPGRMTARIEEGRLCFLSADEATLPPSLNQCVPLKRGENLLSQTHVKILMEPSHLGKNIYKNSIQLVLDSAKIKGTLCVRSRQGGDRIRLRGMTRSLKKIYTDRKFSPRLRARLPVFCDDDGVVAVPTVGIRDGMACEASKEGALTLTVQYCAEEPDEKK